MYRKLTLIAVLGVLVAMCGFSRAGSDSQPVLILLYTRFYDHSHPLTNNERVQRLLALLQKLRAKSPDTEISGLFEFSGSMSQVFNEENSVKHVVDQIKSATSSGLIDIGYTGEDEPSYLYRPKPNLLAADTAEKRWAAICDASQRFLTDFKDPITGHPVPGLTGGLKRMQEVFGDAQFIDGITQVTGGDAPVDYAIRKLNHTAMLWGVPPSDPRRGIESYGSMAGVFANAMSPQPITAPEVFWEDGFLRLSRLSTADNKPHSTDESLDALKKVFQSLDRKHVRVIALEFGSYKRYLAKRSDGSVINDPMEWLYYHPDDPTMPQTVKLWASPMQIEADYKNEEAVLNWLSDEFFPANPGSRFVSVRDLEKMAGAAAPAEMTWDQIKSLADDEIRLFKVHPTVTPNFLTTGDQYFSNAEVFGMLAEEMAAIKKTGSPLPAMRPVLTLGPIGIPNDMGPFRGSLTVRDILEAAAKIAPALRNTEWKQIPDNAVPAYVQAGSYRLNAAQFLHLMALASNDPSPDRVITLSAIEMRSDLTFRYPRNVPNSDLGAGWTLKPAPLHLIVQSASAGR